MRTDELVTARTMEIKCKRCHSKNMKGYSQLCDKCYHREYRNNHHQEYPKNKRAEYYFQNKEYFLDKNKHNSELHITRDLQRKKFIQRMFWKLIEKTSPHRIKRKINNKKGTTREKIKASLIEFWQEHPEAKENLRYYRSKQILPLKDTSIEVKIQSFLTQLHIEYLTHKYISDITHAYQCDIFIPVQDGIILHCYLNWSYSFFGLRYRKI